MEINENNFKEHFFPVGKRYKPQRGQVIARYRCCADLLDGTEKRTALSLVGKHRPTAQKILEKLVGMSEKESDKLLTVFEEELKSNSFEEVAKKPHPFVLEKMFWTKEEFVPVDDPHWEVIRLTFCFPESEEKVTVECPHEECHQGH